jgi:hypothetical protein
VNPFPCSCRPLPGSDPKDKRPFHDDDCDVWRPRTEELWDVAELPFLPMPSGSFGDLSEATLDLLEGMASERNYGRASHGAPLGRDDEHYREAEPYLRNLTWELDLLLPDGDPDVKQDKIRRRMEREKFRTLDNESEMEVFAKSGNEDMYGWHVPWRERTGFDPGRRALEFTPKDHERVLHELGFSRETIAAINGRKSRKPRTVREEADKRRLERAIFDFLEGGQKQDGRWKLLEEATGLNRDRLSKLRSAERLRRGGVGGMHKPTKGGRH